MSGIIVVLMISISSRIKPRSDCYFIITIINIIIIIITVVVLLSGLLHKHDPQCLVGLNGQVGDLIQSLFVFIYLLFVGHSTNFSNISLLTILRGLACALPRDLQLEWSRGVRRKSPINETTTTRRVELNWELIPS